MQAETRIDQPLIDEVVDPCVHLTDLFIFVQLTDLSISLAGRCFAMFFSIADITIYVGCFSAV